MVTRQDIQEGLLEVKGEAARLERRVAMFRGDVREFTDALDERVNEVKLALGKLNDFVGRMEES